VSDHRKELPTLVYRLPSPEQALRFNGWLDQNKSPFLAESFDILRDAMQKIWGYLELHHLAAREHLNRDVIVAVEPVFNAFLDARSKRLIDPESGQDVKALPEICVNIGVPIMLACLRPVFLFAAREAMARQDSTVPTELLVVVARVHEALHFDAFPPAFATSLHQDPAFPATLTFILAHETSHYLFGVDRSSAQKYREIAGSVFNQLLSGPDFFTAPQIAQTKRLFQDPALHASWVEELAADVMAYDICSSICDQKGRRDLMGITTLCAMQAIFEHYLELEEIRFAPTHPYAAARLLAFEKHRQNVLSLRTADFKTTLDWQLPTRWFDSVRRVLRCVGKSYYPEDNARHKDSMPAVEENTGAPNGATTPNDGERRTSVGGGGPRTHGDGLRRGWRLTASMSGERQWIVTIAPWSSIRTVLPRGVIRATRCFRNATCTRR
jgi:hypothetical protein